MRQDDRQFLKIINNIARQQGFVLPALDTAGAPSSEAVSAWATFLQECVRQGVTLSDQRWTRIVVKPDRGVSVFGLSATDAPPERSVDDTEDFRVGLQLFMGMLSSDAESDGDD